MKKILAIISLVLVFVILAAVPSFAEESEYVWEDPKDIPKYYASDISSKSVPVIDGVINPDEYGNVITITDNYITKGGPYPDCNNVIDDSRADQPASEKFEYYFAYDEENIYIAFKDYGGVWENDSATAQFLDSLEAVSDGYRNYAARSNYYIHLGFILDDVNSSIVLGCSSRGFDESHVFDMGTNISGHLDAKVVMDEVYLRKYLASDGTVFAKSDISGSLVPDVKGNTNQYVGQFIAECEIRIAKERILEVLETYNYMEYEEIGNACWIRICNRSYVIKKSEDASYSEPVTAYNDYFGNDTRSNRADYVDYGALVGDKQQVFPSLLVFAPEGTPIKMCSEEAATTVPAATEPVVTEPAVTEPAATEPAATEPAATEPAATEPAATEPAATEPAATEPAAEGGCGGVVSFAGLALVAALGTCTVFVAKKKED